MATEAVPALGLGRAVERLVIRLPPMERACVLLKDVFDDSLVEIAELVDSTVGGGPLGTLNRCELIGEVNAIPRTRRMILDSGIAIEEELFYQADDTRRIYYRKDDAFGTSGYVASSYVDEIDDDRCRLYISSWFDSSEDVSAVTARFESIYRGIFDGFQKYFGSWAAVAEVCEGTC